MKPAAFDYIAPTTLQEAVRLLAEGGEDAKLLAGGQSLVPLMNLRLAQPSLVVDLNKVEGLSYIKEADGGVVVGAMTRHREIEESPILRESVPLLSESARHIGYPSIRLRGTLGGSLAHADPVSEFPCACLSLQAEMVLVGPDGSRMVRAEDFFISYLTTAIEPGEILAEVRFPKIGSGAGWSFLELARKTGDFALVAVAATVVLKDDGICESASIATAGASDKPLRMGAAEEILRSRSGDEAIADAAAQAAAASDPPSDIHSSGEYRRQMIEVLTRRALVESWDRAEGGR